MPRPQMWALVLGVAALLALLQPSASVAAQSTTTTPATTSTSTSRAVVPSGTACKEMRVRRPWELFSADEKARYIAAVKLAMTKGYHQKFVELHTEWFSELEAHRTCVFIYWHRMYLLGYENMLRSLGSEYECVTLPYWDHLSATARQASGTCNFLEGCSPIVQDFGGSRVGPLRTMTVYNVTIARSPGFVCVNQSMLSSFCGNGTTCANCVVRGTTYKNAYPAEAYFGSVYQQMFNNDTWLGFADAIERGVHNTVHSAIGGTMTYFQSPTDPLFYTHHGLIDALQTIYLKCQNGGESLLTDTDKSSDPRFWANCARRNNGTFKASDRITMNTLDYSGKKWVNVRSNPNNTLNAFFKDLPATFGEYVDAKDLGAYSYTYELTGALANMYTNCKDANTLVAAVVSLVADEQDDAAGAGYSKSKPLRPRLQAPTPVDDKMRRWTIAVYEAARIAGYTASAAREQMELILCVHKDECFGGVADYDAVFRANFKVTGHPRCFTLLEQLRLDRRAIGIPGWRAVTNKFFPCKKTAAAAKALTATVSALAMQ